MKKTILLLLLSASLQGGILTKLSSNNDHGIWTQQMVILDLTKDLEMRYRSEQRLAANYKKYYFYDFEMVWQYKIIPGLTFGPGYNLTYQLANNTLNVYKWVWINRPILEARLNFHILDWEIKNRFRGEYYGYTKPHYKDYGLYRNRLEAYAPWEFTCLKINPFINNEWFLRQNTYSKKHPNGLVGVYYENRFQIGFQLKPKEQLESSFFWQMRSIKQKPQVHPTWFNTYQYCFNLNLHF